MKTLINLYSILVAHAFAAAWNSGLPTEGLLNHYIATRRRLPIMSDGLHWGNHWLSSKKPLRATQGW